MLIMYVFLGGLIALFAVAFIFERTKRKQITDKLDQKIKEIQNVTRVSEAVLQNVRAFVLLINTDFKVLKTNYYSITGAIEGVESKRVGDLLRCNNALSAEHGCGTHELCGSCPVRLAIRKAFEEKKGFANLEASLNIQTATKEIAVCKAAVSSSFLNLDNEDYMVITVYDLTHQKNIERELEEARQKAEEASRSKSAFLANMSHDIRTPLNAIVGFSELLAGATREEDKMQYQEILKMNTDLLMQLVNDILDLSKIEAGTLEFVYSDVDMNLLMSDLIQLFKMKQSDMGNADVLLLSEPALESCVIYTDRNRIAQVMSNFLSNAMKFTVEGSIRLGYTSNEEGLYFYVTDSGAGIPEEKQTGVFDRFVKLQKEKNGTGLGLSICRTIVEKLGGKIGVKSTVGKGSTFWFTLPLQPKAISVPDRKQTVTIEENKEQETISAGNKKLTILVAEDMEDNYRLCEAILSSRYDLLWAHNGEEAISLFLQHQPDIILMDIRMPEVNGYEATQAIRQMSATIPIIALTAFAYEEDRKKVMESGFTDFLTKPISSKVLLEKLKSLKKI